MVPSVNLALHLRLARILKGGSSGGEARLTPEAQACLALLDDLMVAMDERVELLRLPEAVAVVAEETVVLESEETAATETMPVADIMAAALDSERTTGKIQVEVEVEVEVEASAALEDTEPPEIAPTIAVEKVSEDTPLWGRLHDQLYEDVLWLFKMGDNEGALNSLARLMDFGEGTEEMERFMTINRDKLFGLYHRLVGEPHVMIERAEDAAIGDRYFFRRGEVETLLEQVNGSRPIGEVIDASALPDLKVYSYLHRIRREGLVRIHRSDA